MAPSSRATALNSHMLVSLLAGLLVCVGGLGGSWGVTQRVSGCAQDVRRGTSPRPPCSFSPCLVKGDSTFVCIGFIAASPSGRSAKIGGTPSRWNENIQLACGRSLELRSESTQGRKGLSNNNNNNTCSDESDAPRVAPPKDHPQKARREKGRKGAFCFGADEVMGEVIGESGKLEMCPTGTRW